MTALRAARATLAAVALVAVAIVLGRSSDSTTAALGASATVSATAVAGDGTIGLSWSSTKTGRGFEVLWRIAGPTVWSTAVVPAGTSSHTITGLTDGKSYDWQVVLLTGSGTAAGNATPQSTGPTSPTGPTGPTSPTSPTGPTGPTGPTAPTGPTGPTTPPGTPVPNGVGGSWTLVLDSEFNGSTLPSPWTTGWFGSGITQGVGGSGENDCYDPAQTVVGNGELDLNLIKKTETCGGKSHQYATGFVTTDGKFSYTYGFVEARVWIAEGSQGQAVDWPSFWQDGQNWPSDGELDVLEGLDGDVCAHWHGPTGNGTGYGTNGGSGCPGTDYAGGWHTFGADWEPGKVTWYYDGQNIGCVETSGSDCGGASHDSQITGAPQYLILGMGIGSPAVAPAAQRNDYVRVWQHPGATPAIRATRLSQRGAHPDGRHRVKGHR